MQNCALFSPLVFLSLPHLFPCVVLSFRLAFPIPSYASLLLPFLEPFPQSPLKLPFPLIPLPPLHNAFIQFPFAECVPCPDFPHRQRPRLLTSQPFQCVKNNGFLTALLGRVRPKEVSVFFLLASGFFCGIRCASRFQWNAGGYPFSHSCSGWAQSVFVFVTRGPLLSTLLLSRSCAFCFFLAALPFLLSLMGNCLCGFNYHVLFFN